MHVCLVHVGLVLVLWCDICRPCCRRWHNKLNEPLDPFPIFGWLLNKKTASVEVNISLAFLHWVQITFRPWPFVSDITVFMLKRDVKLQLSNFAYYELVGVTRAPKDRLLLTKLHDALHHGRTWLQTNKVDAQCDKLVTELSWQHFMSKDTSFQLPTCIWGVLQVTLFEFCRYFRHPITIESLGCRAALFAWSCV